MHTDIVSIAERIKANGISMSAERTDSNPAMADSDNMDHWKCVITRKVLRQGYDTWHGYTGKLGAVQYSTRRMTIVFSQGYGHNGKAPELSSVLDCLVSDASILENAPKFEDYCSEFGYDRDSRKAEKSFKALEHQTLRLQNFLGELYEEFVWNTERE